MTILFRGHPIGEAGIPKLRRRNRGRIAAICAALGTAAVFSAKVPQCFFIPGARVLRGLVEQNSRRPSCPTHPRDLSLVALSAGKFDGMKVAELKELCTEKGLKVTGKKADLLARLEEVIAGKFGDMKVAELKELCTEKGLKVTGKKADLIARLEEAEGGGEAQGKVGAPKKKSSSKKNEPEPEIEAQADDTKGSSDEGFKAGQLARAKFHGDGRFYTVTLVKDNGDGTWAVKWAEDGSEDTANLEDLIPQNKKFKAGDLVVAKCADDGLRYTGIVKRDNGDGRVDLVWLDDNKETVLLDDMFRQIKKYKVGQKVEAKFPDDGVFYGATNAKDLGKCKYAVEWDEDGDGLTELTIDEVRIPRVDLENIEVGAEMKGTILRVRGDLGGFVDVGAWVDGLLHKSQIASDGAYVENAEDFIREDDEITVWVQSVDLEQKRLSLTQIKENIGKGPGGPRPPPRDFTHPIDELTVGQELEGTVTGVRDFGVFVDVGSERNGLVHVSRLANTFVDNVEDFAKMGDEVKVWVSDIRDGKLALSMVDPENL
eukprot:TRINITY_DN13891_c0_g1_i1.p1 TRINITY_DN13891_c0_g1~~TRINITY_DN13891_c0_g1_i1.p1  ORF type:complete len:543 (-),score=116.49 TRINITY_DN13891_c0_g1_i1:209-1837(-)